MRRISFAVVFGVAILAVSYGLLQRHRLAQKTSRIGRRVMYYVDPMHPAYKSDRPGTAPDCGMALQPVFAEDVGNERPSLSSAQIPAGTVNIDGAMQRLAGIRVAPVTRNGASRVVRIAGRVLPEDTRIYKINSGVDGFVRDTYRDAVGTVVTKDRKLATYYAPEFLAAASGFLAASERVPGSVADTGARSIQNYTDRLRNLGISDLQVKRIADSRQLPESIDVVAPVNGVILARNISPGQHFEHDMEFYRIADLSRVWVVAEAYLQDEPYLHPGALAQITLREEGRHLSARITDSLPQSDGSGSTIKLRLEVDNTSLVLRPDMVVDVDLPVRLQAAVTIPIDALIDSGAHARVYVEHGEGIFEPREVETGWRNAERIEILKGLEPGERVVVGATFLVDSESRFKSADAAATQTDKQGGRTEDLARAR